MAPRDVPKSTIKMDKANVKKNLQKAKSSSNIGVKKTVVMKTRDKTPIKPPKTPISQHQRTATMSNVETPKQKENKSIQPVSGVKSAKKSSWKRRPKPAHSGVPMPEKMQRLGDKMFNELNCSF